MDLGTIKERLETNYYDNAEKCIEDFNTMFANCYKYNPCGDDVVKMCKSLQETFQEKVADMPQEVSMTLFDGLGISSTIRTHRLERLI